MKDELFKNPNWGEKLKTFHFQEDVSNVFDDMITRSVPFYQQTQTLLKDAALIAAIHWQSQKNKKKKPLPKATPILFDLGCSTGTTLLAIKNAFTQTNNINSTKKTDTTLPNFIRAVGIDSSSFMLKKAQEKMQALSQHTQQHAAPTVLVNLLNDDISNFTTHIKKDEHCIFISLTYTLQFIQPTARLKLLTNIYNSLAPGGRLMLCEKITEDSPLLTKEAEATYYLFKRQNHYSQSEISRKRQSLEKTLKPNSCNQHLKRLKRAGFTHIAIVQKWFNFAIICALK